MFEGRLSLWLPDTRADGAWRWEVSSRSLHACRARTLTRGARSGCPALSCGEAVTDFESINLKKILGLTENAFDGRHSANIGNSQEPAAGRYFDLAGRL